MLQVILFTVSACSLACVAFVFFPSKKVSQRHASVAHQLGYREIEHRPLRLHVHKVAFHGLFVCCINNSVV